MSFYIFLFVNCSLWVLGFIFGLPLQMSTCTLMFLASQGRSLTAVTDDEKVIVSEYILKDDKNVDVGDYFMQAIDVGDFDDVSDNTEDSEGPTRQGFFIHEVSERYSTFKNGGDLTIENYNTYHPDGVSAENGANGNVRSEKFMEDEKTKVNYKEKNGSVTTATFNKDEKSIMTITKENNKPE